MYDIEDRVARGTAWLDEHYPNWVTGIDISTLNIASCHLCVLGQVFTGCIPAAEQGQILAQVLEKMCTIERATAAEAIEEGAWGGFNTMVEHHRLLPIPARLGFSTDWVGPVNADGEMISAAEELILLTDEWTRVIISRRLAPYRAELELVAA